MFLFELTCQNQNFQMIHQKLSYFLIATDATIRWSCRIYMFQAFEKNNIKLLEIYPNSLKNTCEGTPFSLSQAFSRMFFKF